MNLQELILNDMKEAMKGGLSDKLSVLRMLKSSIKYKEIEKGKGYKLSDNEIIEIISSSIKQRKDSIEQFSKGNREDLVEKEKKEMEFLQLYLPAQLTQDELETEIKSAINEANATSVKDLGKVMKIIIPRTSGRADGALVSKLIKEKLS